MCMEVVFMGSVGLCIGSVYVKEWLIRKAHEIRK